MRGDFSQLYKDDPNIIGVLHQQGRAIRDADLNEQTLRLWELMTAMARDMEAKVSHPAPAFDAEKNLIIEPSAYYVHGMRIELPKLTVVKSDLDQLCDDTISKFEFGKSCILYVEVENVAGEAIQHRRYSDTAIQNGQTSGIRWVLKPRLRLAKDDAWQQGEDPNKPTPPDLKLRLLEESDNRLYRFEVHEILTTGLDDQGNATRTTEKYLKWSGDNSFTLHTVAMVVPADVPKPPTDRPRVAKVDAVRLLSDTAVLLRDGQWIEFVRPANSSVATRRTGSLAQIKVKGNEITFFKGDQRTSVEIELDAKEDVVPDMLAGTVEASFIVWDNAKKLPLTATEIPGAEDQYQVAESGFVLSGDLVDGPLHTQNHDNLIHGDSWIFEVRKGRADVITGVFHRRSYLGIYQHQLNVPPDNAGASHRADPGTKFVNSEPQPANPNLAQPPSVEEEGKANAGSERQDRHIAILDMPLERFGLQVASPALRRWIASADLDEVAFVPVDELTENVLSAMDVPSDQRSFVEADVKSFVRQIDDVIKQLSMSASGPAHA